MGLRILRAGDFYKHSVKPGQTPPSTVNKFNCSKAHFYKHIFTHPDFPQPKLVGGTKQAWLEDDVDQFISEHLFARTEGAA